MGERGQKMVLSSGQLFVLLLIAAVAVLLAGVGVLMWGVNSGGKKEE
jgi:flagellar basal body-associated protein FliL